MCKKDELVRVYSKKDYYNVLTTPDLADDRSKQVGKNLKRYNQYVTLWCTNWKVIIDMYQTMWPVD